MDRLHRSDDAEAGHPRHVLGVHALRVLDARPPHRPGVAVRRQRVQGAAHGAVADRVEAHVQLGACAALDQVDQVWLREANRARAVEHLSGAAAQRSVEERLHPPDAQPLIAPSRTHPHPFGVGEIRDRHVVGHPDRQWFLDANSLQRRERTGGIHRMHRRETQSREVAKHRRHGGVEVGVGWSRQEAQDHVHGRLAQDSCRCAISVPVDRASRRILACHVDARRAQGRGRDPRRVAVLPLEVGRPAAHRSIELPPRRKRRGRPRVVVPTGPDHPGVLRQRLHPFPGPSEHVAEILGAGEVDGQLAVDQALEVDVRINQPWPGVAAQSHHLGLPAGRRPRLRPDRDDPAVERRHLRRASGEENGRDQRPYDLAMISFMISSVPAPIRARRASRQARSTGNSRM